MKKITTSKGTFIFVEVPDTWQPTASSTFEIMHKLYLHEVVHIKADLEFICTTSNATEEQAAMVVEEMGYINGNIGYKSYHKEIEAICPSSLFSLISLIDGSGLNIDKNYAILKQI